MFLGIGRSLKRLVVFLLALSFVVLSPARAAEWAPDTPDIYLIIADDMGAGDINATSGGKSKIPTPNMDRLANEGMHFTMARAANSICSPTRYTVLTGRYPWRTGVIEGKAWTFSPPYVDPAIVTLPEMLKAKGYATYLFGKWHLGEAFRTTDWRPPNAERSNVDWKRPFLHGPVDHGYDYFFGRVHNAPPRTYVENDRLLDMPEIIAAVGDAGHQAPRWAFSRFHRDMTDKAINKIESAGPGPIFIHYAPFLPHKPIVPEDRYVGSSEAGPYGDFIVQLDDSIGRLLSAIHKRGRPALLFLTSDNGSGGYSGHGRDFGDKGSIVTAYGHEPNNGLRDWKHSIYEGGLRVPLLVWWPGVVPAGASSENPVLTNDYYRTIARVVGYDVPPDQGLDSFDFWPSVLPRVDRLGPKRTVSITQDYDGHFALINMGWKVIPEKSQMYDLAHDGHEAINLWDVKSGIRSTLVEQLNGAKASNATYPDF